MAKHSGPPPSCPRCGGDGEITVNIDNKEQTVTCPVCKGSGNA
jgi:DnaJ-class molecular chaperone